MKKENLVKLTAIRSALAMLVVVFEENKKISKTIDDIVSIIDDILDDESKED